MESLISEVLADSITFVPVYINLFPHVLECFIVNSHSMSLLGIMRAWLDLFFQRGFALALFRHLCLLPTWDHFNLVSKPDHSGSIILNLTPVWMQQKNYKFVEEPFFSPYIDLSLRRLSSFPWMPRFSCLLSQWHFVHSGSY